MGLFSIFKKSNTLYFPGCITYYKYKDSFENYKNIFNKLGIDFKIIDKKVCCGLPAFEAGYNPEARKLAKRNFEIFKEEEITSIITNSPCCQKFFLQDYPNLLPDWNIETKNIWRIILSKLESKPGLVKHKRSGSVVYHDSCYLGRYCEIYEDIRKILEIIGYDVKEFFDNKEYSICCGSCGQLPITNPGLADEIAREKILQAKRINAKRIIVSSLKDYDLLKKNSDNEVEIIEIGEVIAFALGINKKDDLFESESEESNEEIIENNEEEFAEKKIDNNVAEEKIEESSSSPESDEGRISSSSLDDEEKEVNRIISNALSKSDEEIRFQLEKEFREKAMRRRKINYE